MKLWGKSFLAIFALSLLSYGISGAAYAAVEPLSIITEEFYGEGNTITISGFVKKEENNGDILYSLDAEKLTKALENDENFKNIDDGLAKLDSFLN